MLLSGAAVYLLLRERHPPRARLVLVPAAQASPAERSENGKEGADLATVVKVLELVGESEKSWEEAVKNAVAEAAKTVRGITGVEVCNMTANVQNGDISRYKANVKVAFVVESDRPR